MTTKEKLLKAVKEHEYYELDKLFDEILKKKSKKDICKKWFDNLLKVLHRVFLIG